MEIIPDFTLKLIKKTKIADQVFELTFSKPEGFVFEAGQFVQFRIPTPEKLVNRSYSVSSVPNDKELEFCIKVVPGGVGSTYLSNLKPGESVAVSNSKGHFVAKDIKSKIVFIATGVGLSPMMSLIKDLSEKGKNKIRLLFGVRHQKDIFWLDRLEQIKTDYNDFDYKLTLSQPETGWNGSVGRVTNHIEVDPDAHYFICGNVQMVKDVRQKLIENGLNTKSIHMEIF